MYAYFVSVASFVSDIYLSLLQNGAVSNIHTRIQNGGNGAEHDVIVQINSRELTAGESTDYVLRDTSAFASALGTACSCEQFSIVCTNMAERRRAP